MRYIAISKSLVFKPCVYPEDAYYVDGHPKQDFHFWRQFMEALREYEGTQPGQGLASTTRDSEVAYTWVYDMPDYCESINDMAKTWQPHSYNIRPITVVNVG